MDINEIFAMYNEVREQTIVDNLVLHNDDINNSVVTLSWCGKTKEGILSPSIGMISEGRFGEGISQVQLDYFLIIYPANYTKEMVADFEKENDLEYTFNAEHGLETLIGKVVRIAIKISETSKLVSRSLDIGIQCLSQEGLVKIKAFIDFENIDENGNTDIKTEIVDVQTINWSQE
jgi:hypothetical protein